MNNLDDLSFKNEESIFICFFLLIAALVSQYYFYSCIKSNTNKRSIRLKERNRNRRGQKTKEMHKYSKKHILLVIGTGTLCFTAYTLLTGNY